MQWLVVSVLAPSEHRHVLWGVHQEAAQLDGQARPAVARHGVLRLRHRPRQDDQGTLTQGQGGVDRLHLQGDTRVGAFFLSPPPTSSLRLSQSFLVQFRGFAYCF